MNVTVSPGRASGAATATTFKVVKQLSQVDKASWDYISQYGSDDEVWTFIEQGNIERLDLVRVAWRARTSVDFFRRLIATMEKRHLYSDVIYSYGGRPQRHGVAARVAAASAMTSSRQCGAWLDTKLASDRPDRIAAPTSTSNTRRS